MMLFDSVSRRNLATVLLLSVAGCKDAGSTESTAAKTYPLDKCVISDEKLGSMGEPVVFVYHGQQIKLCCNNCRKDFDKEPAKYLAKILSH